MSLGGIGTEVGTLPRPLEEAGRGPLRERPRDPALPSGAPLRSPGALAPLEDTLPADVPVGIDPELWRALTPEERTFFARAGSLGPLTYGRRVSAGPSEAPAFRGIHIDIRV